MIHRKVIFIAALFLLPFTSLGQKPTPETASEIYQKIKKLNFLGSVLYVAAHPDDENTKMISYFANEKNARTAYLSLTRGDGGQNLIGPELREELGVIRTQELLAARQIDGGEQLFSRANDFGYSKHPDETLEIWNKKEVLSDVVWAIRKFKPDVIINRFEAGSPGSTHGHHTTSAILSKEAFDLADEEDVFPQQLKYVSAWQPKRMFFNTSWWFYGSKEAFEKADKSDFIEINTGVYFPSKGLSNTEIAALSRSQHKSQGFGTSATRGNEIEYLKPIKGDFPEDTNNVFSGINTSWSRIKGGEAIGEILKEVEQNYDFTNPAASIPMLVEAYKLIQNLENTHWRKIKSDEIKEIIAASAGLFLEARVSQANATAGDKLNIQLEAVNRSSKPMELSSITVLPEDSSTPLDVLLKNNEAWQKEIELHIANTAEYTNPYWLKNEGTLGMYKVEDQLLRGLPETPRDYKVVFNIEVNGTRIPFSRNIIYNTSNPVQGEVYTPFEIVPPISVENFSNVYIFSDSETQSVLIKLKAYKDNLEGKLKLNHPQNWKVSPETIEFQLSKKNEEKIFEFQLFPPNSQDEAIITPLAHVDGKVFSKEVLTINYPHIEQQTLLVPSKFKAVKLDIERKGEKIAYVEGAGDVIPQSLEQIGYQVDKITLQEVTLDNLKNYDAVVLGIRAYNVLEELKFKQPVLFEYVKNGGNLIVQYNTSHRLKVEELAPYDLELSRDRVTNENAEVQFLQPKHPILNKPNKITSADFENWVQERGLYFPNEWENEFTPILSMHDKNENPKKGSLLVAKYGKGYYIYTGLSFFRQFPAGVAGAYRLFANLISLGNNDE